MPAIRPVRTKRFDVPDPQPNSPNERFFDVLWRWSALDDAVASIWIDDLQVVPEVPSATDISILTLHQTQTENSNSRTNSLPSSNTMDTSILTLHQNQSENSKPRTNRLPPSNTMDTSILTLHHQNQSDSSTPDRLPSRSKKYWPLKFCFPI
ncbi:hypothetical protein VC83_08997 [Pseudogymnoascus destructans]|uniref:Uncharacterized protein n=1 Tax=Pseudogymnoascus destructans TaxID=655981 RepID=A0A176ZYU1_9PEZI|nr:uncharacterized protein VC83_08997 [Pseudogymnoascus destructans]OAF54490.1 hypothetical protein VC83_08997 [Pseudogymnoascus destructans]